jgi:hypothetical protein
MGCHDRRLMNEWLYPFMGGTDIGNGRQMHCKYISKVVISLYFYDDRRKNTEIIKNL